MSRLEAAANWRDVWFEGQCLALDLCPAGGCDAGCQALAAELGWEALAMAFGAWRQVP